MRALFFAPRWFVYASELCTLALTHEQHCPVALDLYALTEHMSVFASQSNAIRNVFFFLLSNRHRQLWSSWDKYMATTKNELDEIKQCSRAQRITHRNKIDAKIKFGYWFCVLALSSVLLFTTWFIFRFHWNEPERPCFTSWMRFFFTEFLNERDMDLDEVEWKM